MNDGFLFGVFPYLAVALAVVGGVQRYRTQRHTVTAHSSQLLEARLQYWGSVPWHNAIILVLLGHLVAVFLPGSVAALLGSATRLVVVEVTGLALGLLALVGLLVLMVRRLRLGAVTVPLDWVVMLLLLLQVATGVTVAWSLRWGLAWFPFVATPWLASLARLQPRTDLMASLPMVVKIHAVNAFVLVALLPFTRLVHIVTVPLGYLWRLPQLVIWRRAPTATGEGPR
jgi:nitrate reductase gamma subunit